MYRANRVRIGLGRTDVAGGHLHVPSVAPPASGAAVDAEYLGRVSGVVAQIVAMVRVAGEPG
ncbi:hypothetical protein JOF53_003649 [Crossiella equi]|uniref:Uncharacterized protein n=1 Tax=Crossiella equi TaxID=130796 RepID=A0ABS5AEP6_9PSEU|nr:hypothetical protein [Crossiella equi]MBP2474777.1 hypothetical protein [Crossiella equi]